jgi:hypothetical protein
VSYVKEFPHFIVLLAGVLVLVWLYPKLANLYGRLFGEPPAGRVRWINRRNRTITVFGKNDQEVL